MSDDKRKLGQALKQAVEEVRMKVCFSCFFFIGFEKIKKIKK